MVLKIDYKKLIKNLAIPLLVGIVSGFLTRGGVEQYSQNAAKPFFTPPDWVCMDCALHSDGCCCIYS